MESGIEQLRDWMERRGFNQTETAAHLGLDVPYVSQLMNGHRRPGLANAVAIADKTGIPVEAWLIGSDESDERLTAPSGKRKVGKG